MRTVICGHATLLVETADQRILIDPVFSRELVDGALRFYPQRRIFPERMPPPTVLVITHGHFDHFHPASLATIPRELPVVMPRDADLLARINGIGFERVSVLDPWQTLSFGQTSVTATSSSHEEPEFGLIVKDGDAALWHMADGEVEPHDGRHARQIVGKIDVVACKYQPVVNASMSYLRGHGNGFDADQVCAWLEAACAGEPRFVFPYASGLCFTGEHAWFNRYAFPLTAENAAALLIQRLGTAAIAKAVLPGDVIEANPQGVRHTAQSAGFVEYQETPVPPRWEPIDTATLIGLPDDTDVAELRTLLRSVLGGPVAQWLQQALQLPSSMWRDFVDWGVVWQLAVHANATRRLNYAIDFRDAAHVLLSEGEHPAANFFTHLSGGTLLRVLRGEADGLLFWLAGDARSYEKIICIKDGRLSAPALPRFAHLRPSDPLTYFLRHYWTKDDARRISKGRQ
jgi:L-ascorbate metabolism protein UlaG (beta-lactamase superfamily)